MAKVKVVRETPKPELPPIKEVVLTLTAEEAQTLRAVAGAITNDPEFAEERRHMNNIFNVLQEAGITRDLLLRNNTHNMHFGKRRP